MRPATARPPLAETSSSSRDSSVITRASFRASSAFAAASCRSSSGSPRELSSAYSSALKATSLPSSPSPSHSSPSSSPSPAGTLFAEDPLVGEAAVVPRGLPAPAFLVAGEGFLWRAAAAEGESCRPEGRPLAGDAATDSFSRRRSSSTVAFFASRASLSSCTRACRALSCCRSPSCSRADTLSFRCASDSASLTLISSLATEERSGLASELGPAADVLPRPRLAEGEELRDDGLAGSGWCGFSAARSRRASDASRAAMASACASSVSRPR
mmetsp:Transcript_9494/g.27153  ORF Transcript_9494/g.27153 Transcript_9494/m.27153 type:complete len:271 (-) Transcript_9494:71-883(-)